MAIVGDVIGGHKVTYDSQTGQILGFTATDDYSKRKEEATKTLLSRKEEFKQRGYAVVKSELKKAWAELVDNSMSTENLDQVWYNGTSIEAVLACMEKLSMGLSIEESYLPIDVQNPSIPCIYSNMQLSGWQNHSVTSAVGSYHQRGEEFCNYRNAKVNESSKKK